MPWPLDENKEIHTLKNKIRMTLRFLYHVQSSRHCLTCFWDDSGEREESQIEMCLTGKLAWSYLVTCSVLPPLDDHTWWPSSYGLSALEARLHHDWEYGLHWPHPLSHRPVLHSLVRISQVYDQNFSSSYLEPGISLWRSWISNKQGRRSRNWSWRDCRCS